MKNSCWNLQGKKLNQVQKKPRRKVCHGAEVVTRTEVKEIQENQMMKMSNKKRNLKVPIRRQAKKAKYSSDSEDESWLSDASEDRISEFDDLDSEHEILMETQVTEEPIPTSIPEAPIPTTTTENNNQPAEIIRIAVGDYILVRFVKKKQIYRYVCVVTELYDDEAEVTCLRKLKSNREFRLDQKDMCSIDLSDVEEKLPHPEILAAGSKNIYVFEKAINVIEKKC